MPSVRAYRVVYLGSGLTNISVVYRQARWSIISLFACDVWRSRRHSVQLQSPQRQAEQQPPDTSLKEAARLPLHLASPYSPVQASLVLVPRGVPELIVLCGIGDK